MMLHEDDTEHRSVNSGGYSGGFARGEIHGENFATGEILLFFWGTTVPSFTRAAGIVFPEKGRSRLRTNVKLRKKRLAQGRS